MSHASPERTVLDALVEALALAGRYNRQDQVAPAAVLWTDEDWQWEPLLPLLRARLPILTCGQYDPATRSGPSYWIRCMIARALPEDRIPDDQTPIVYLPGIGRHQLRAIEESPRALQPLAELQYRGVYWTQRSSRDWTIAAFLQSADGGLGIRVGTDDETKAAMRRALSLLATESLARLRRLVPLRADFFNGLLTPDAVKALLLWLNDPQGYRAQFPPEGWDAFRDVARRTYGFDPERDGPIVAARKLGERHAEWAAVWDRFAESPRSYPGIPALLGQAESSRQPTLFDIAGSWPRANQAAETDLRNALRALADDPAPRATVGDLERRHGERRGWVWSTLGETPLADALAHLARLARVTERDLVGETVAGLAAAYADWAWQADAAAVDALGAASAAPAIAAVMAGVTALYRPWLNTAVRQFQQAVRDGGYPWEPLGDIAPGTCLLFSDALRFDVGQRLAERLRARGRSVQVGHRLAALPSITPTAKPATTPVADQLTGGDEDLTARVRSTGATVTAEVLRRLLGEAGYQILIGVDTGDPAGRAWTEIGAIDSYGHEHGWRLARHLPGEVEQIAERVDGLLEAGWQRAVIVTDHGWLMLPQGLDKAELPAHLTTLRKGRCARIRPLAGIDEQTVPWHWNPDVRVAVAPGITCFEAGKEYEHGGLSPQECVVPILTVTAGVGTAGAIVTIEATTWRGLRCNVRVGGDPTGLTADIRTRAADPSTSLLHEPKPVAADGSVALFAEPEHEGAAALVVLLGPDGGVRAQALTTVGAR